MTLLWLIPLMPALGAAILGLIGVRWFGRTASAWVACAAMTGAFGMSLWGFADLLALAPSARVHDVVLGSWIPAIPLATVRDIAMFQVNWAFRLDPLSAVMVLVVTGIGLIIHVYATAYIKDEPNGSYARFFCYLNLFCAFMLVLVLAGNFLVMFVGWEGVGLCSYLLIGFWYEKTSAADAGKKAFIVNRIGDWGFILGICLVFFTFGTLDFREVASAAAALPQETAAFGALSLICLSLFVGAAGKSAQFPLHVWLPDAMEGPTPVSALIHAATMVTAGVYMVARNAALFEQAPLVMQIVAIVGALTALMAAAIGLVQNDIKRVLAYSTVSQLGYMFLATGLGAFGAGIFHLVTHAFFKALLFLGSGSVIHAMAGEQDMHRMGGLRKFMPVTFVTMMLGTLAIAGIPPLAGFFSKDAIIYQAFLGNRMLWAIALVTSLLTAFYMFRLMALTFYGSYRGPAWTRTASPAAAAEAAAHGARHPRDAHAHGQAQKPDHEVSHGAAEPSAATPSSADVAVHGRTWHGPHESSGAMTGPLMALAVGAMVAGFIGIPQVLGGENAIELFLAPSFAADGAAGPGSAGPGSAGLQAGPGSAGLGSAGLQAGQDAVHHVSRGAELGLMLLSVLAAVAGLLAARHCYLSNPGLPARLAARWHGAHALLFNHFYIDELYHATAVRGTFGAARLLWIFDRRVVDAAVNGAGWVTQIAAWCSHMFDSHVVDGAVNLAARTAGRGSFFARRVQTGLVQNYALLMVFGLFAFLTIYLVAR